MRPIGLAVIQNKDSPASGADQASAAIYRRSRLEMSPQLLRARAQQLVQRCLQSQTRHSIFAHREPQSLVKSRRIIDGHADSECRSDVATPRGLR